MPKVSTHLLLREGVEIPDHLRHLPDVSPQRQVLAMGFSWALYFCQKMVESCVLASGLSPDAMLMDRHRAPATSHDSICFGVYVDCVCAVGGDRPKVLAATAVKATLDAAGLQCSEVEADTSRTGILKLEASRVWRLRHGLEFAACRKQPTGEQVAKLIGHITWSCLLRRPALSLINAGYRFARTFGPRSRRLWPAVAQEFRWIASLLPLFTCNLVSPWSPWVYAAVASGGVRGGYGVTRR